MTTAQQKVKALCDAAYGTDIQQITIDLIQDDIEAELLDAEEGVTIDSIGAAAYECDILREVMDTKFEKDITLLSGLYEALKEWESDQNKTNQILGIPRHK